jgi:CRP-like cAMP-binding protein
MGTQSRKLFDVNSLLPPESPDRKVVLFAKKQVIFSQGDRNDSIFYVEKHG